MKKFRKLLLLSMMPFCMALGLFGFKAYAAGPRDLGELKLNLEIGHDEISTEYIANGLDSSLNALAKSNRVDAFTIGTAMLGTI